MGGKNVRYYIMEYFNNTKSEFAVLKLNFKSRVWINDMYKHLEK